MNSLSAWAHAWCDVVLAWTVTGVGVLLLLLVSFVIWAALPYLRKRWRRRVYDR
jgi:hypothetical protein